jgi:hypothetical protein
MAHEKKSSNYIENGFKLSLILWSEYLNFVAKCLDAGAGQRKPVTGTCSRNSRMLTAKQVDDRIKSGPERVVITMGNRHLYRK